MNQVLKLADKGCNTEIHTQELKKNMVIMNEQMGHLSRHKHNIKIQNTRIIPI